MLGFAALALNLLAVVSANPLEKRQTSSLVANFPAFVTNATGSGTVSGSISFTPSTGGVTVGVTLTAGNTAARRRQAALGISYTIHTGVSTAGCAAVGPLAPGGDLSAVGGLAYPPTTFTFVDTLISLTVGSPNYIGGMSVVLAYSDGTIIGCANLAVSSTQTTTNTNVNVNSTTNVNVNVNVNVDVNVNVTISVCAFCQPLTTVFLSALFIPAATTIELFNIVFVCTAPGFITVTCPLTVQPGKTVTVQTLQSVTFTQQQLATTTVTCSVCATPTSTVITIPTSIFIPTATTVTPVIVTSLPAVTSVAAVSVAPAVVAPVSVAPAIVTAAKIAQVTGAASKAQLAGALAAVAGAVALL